LPGAVHRYPRNVPTRNDLARTLHRLDRQPYPAYKDLRGRYDFGAFTLSLDHIQGDPFAAPSRLSVHIRHEDSRLPSGLFDHRSRRTGVENCLARGFSAACRRSASHLGSGKSGLLNIDTPGQEVLRRSCCEITDNLTIVRFVAGLPASGRRILGRAAAELLTETVPAVVDKALQYENLDAGALRRAADTNEDADHLRAQLPAAGLVAFVADGAILPRVSGADDHPLADAIPFRSPPSLRATFTLPHAGEVSGMGVPEGVTLIVGGGYHGKSTLLNALERGVYNHRPGDGRELVATRRDAAKVRAEDGRSVVKVNLSPFINNLPGGKDTAAFTTTNASGSTSQAANIVEALEAGSRCLLLDEDISATNFLIRDRRMAELIASDKEPITPFVRQVRALYHEHGISTVLVLGGSGDYFDPAGLVIAMDNYLPRDVTEAAKEIAARSPAPDPDAAALPPLDQLESFLHRIPDPASISPFRQAPPYRGSKPDGARGRGPGRERRPPRKTVKSHGTRALTFGTDEIDLSLVPQLVDDSQVRAIGLALAYALEHTLDGRRPLREALETVTNLIDADGLGALDSRLPGDLAEFRLHEFAATLNRLRSLRVR